MIEDQIDNENFFKNENNSDMIVYLNSYVKDP